jgi:hypothetical protein
MAPSNSHIDKLDFDHERRPLIGDDEGVPSPGPSNATSCSGSFFEQVVEGIQDRDRRLVQRETVRYGSFVAAILSWYVSRPPT